MPMYLHVVQPPVTVTLKFQLPTKGSVVWASVKLGKNPKNGKYARNFREPSHHVASWI